MADPAIFGLTDTKSVSGGAIQGLDSWPVGRALFADMVNSGLSNIPIQQQSIAPPPVYAPPIIQNPYQPQASTAQQTGVNQFGRAVYDPQTLIRGRRNG